MKYKKLMIPALVLLLCAAGTAPVRAYGVESAAASADSQAVAYLPGTAASSMNNPAGTSSADHAAPFTDTPVEAYPADHAAAPMDSQAGTVPAQTDEVLTETDSPEPDRESPADMEPAGELTGAETGSGSDSSAAEYEEGTAGKKSKKEAKRREKEKPKISLKEKSVTLEINDTKSLKADVRGFDREDLTWKSSDPKVAAVDSKGRVTAKGKGTATITAKGKGVCAKCSVKVLNVRTMIVKTTGYCTCSKCCGRWADSPTAIGTMPKQGRTIAVDKDLIRLGTKVKIGDTVYTAEDTGGSIKGKVVDVYYASHSKAIAHGVKYEVAKIYL